MKQVSNIELKNNWKLFTIEPGEQSPMENQQGGEIALDNDAKEAFVHEVFLVTYGTDSIVKSLNKVI